MTAAQLRKQYERGIINEEEYHEALEANGLLDFDALHETWICGNRSDVIEKLTKRSHAVEFALLISKEDQQILLTLLRNCE
jgi:hypothetical protein